jgi:uncharacterized protein YsxB (DUF464 family)
MIRVEIYRNNQNIPYGFSMEGHADYSAYGTDIVCSAVSALVFNAINSIEKFTQESVEYEYETEGGYIHYILPEVQKNKGSKEAILLMQSMEFGLINIEKEYGENISIRFHKGKK